MVIDMWELTLEASKRQSCTIDLPLDDLAMRVARMRVRSECPSDEQTSLKTLLPNRIVPPPANAHVAWPVQSAGSIPYGYSTELLSSNRVS